MSALSYLDFIELLGAKTSLSSKTIRRVLKSFEDIIISELQNEGKINIQNFGKFEVELKGGEDEWIPNELGIPEKRYVDIYNYINFIPSKNYIKKLNEDTQERITRAMFDDFVSDDDLKKECKVKSTSELILEMMAKQKDKKENDKKAMQERKENNVTYRNTYKGKPLKCLTNGITYNSTYHAGKELGIRLDKMYYSFYRDDMIVDGYEFEFVDEELCKKKFGGKVSDNESEDD